MKLCTDCKHMGWDEGPTCIRPLSDRLSPVDGSPMDRLHEFCSQERSGHTSFFDRGRQKCGPSAKFFEPAPAIRSVCKECGR